MQSAKGKEQNGKEQNGKEQNGNCWLERKRR